MPRWRENATCILRSRREKREKDGSGHRKIVFSCTQRPTFISFPLKMQINNQR